MTTLLEGLACRSAATPSEQNQGREQGTEGAFQPTAQGANVAAATGLGDARGLLARLGALGTLLGGARPFFERIEQRCVLIFGTHDQARGVGAHAISALGTAWTVDSLAGIDTLTQLARETLGARLAHARGIGAAPIFPAL